MAPTESPERGGDARALALLFASALSLRPELVGPVTLLDQISRSLGMSHAVAGLVGALPVLCMGVFALVTPAVRRRLGTRATVTLSLGLIALGGLARAASPDTLTFLALTVVVGIGIGTAGAILPVVVRQLVPTKPVGGTASYSTGLQLGAALAAAAAAPLAAALGGWQAALVVLSLACLAPVLVWILVGPVGAKTPEPAASLPRAFLDRGGLMLALVFGLFGTVYYGFISWLPDAYLERGWTGSSAGAVVAALNVMSIIGALTIAFVSKRYGYSLAVAAMGAGFAAAAVGFLLAPDAGFAWAILAGYTNGALFPLLLAQPVRVARSPDQVAWLSAVMLGGGYTIAAIGPVGLGVLRDGTGSFAASFALLAVAGVILAVLSTAVGRQRSAQTA